MRIFEGIGRSAIRHPLGTLATILLIILGIADFPLSQRQSADVFPLRRWRTDNCGLAISTDKNASKEVSTDQGTMLPSGNDVINGISAYDSGKVWGGRQCYKNEAAKDRSKLKKDCSSASTDLRDKTKAVLTGIVPQGTIHFTDGHAISVANAYIQVPKDPTKPAIGDNLLSTTTEILIYVNHDGKGYKVESSNFYIAGCKRG